MEDIQIHTTVFNCIRLPSTRDFAALEFHVLRCFCNEVLDQHDDDDLSTDTMEIMMMMMLMEVMTMKQKSLSDIRVVVPGKSQWNAAG